MLRRLPVTVCWLFAGGCTATPPAVDQLLSPIEERAITDTIRAVMNEYSASWGKINCDNQDAALKFFDMSGPGVIDANETAVTQYPGDAFARRIRDGACSIDREEGRLDSLVVRVLSRDIVSVSWTFSATYYQKQGAPTLARGAVLQVFRRTRDGWKTPVGMSTHQPVLSRNAPLSPYDPARP